ncbi:MAG: DUF4349 domain-containing protein [Rhodoglobus sp.]
MRRSLLIPTVLIVSVLTLAGCSSPTDSSSSNAYPDPAPMMPYSGDMFPGEASAGSTQSTTQTPTDSGMPFSAASKDQVRSVITTGYMSVTVTSPDKASADAISIAESVGGRVDGRSEYAPRDGDRGSASVTLRIPSAKLTATIEKFKELGTLQEVSINAVDVTMESRDLDARITALDTSVQRLLALLDSAQDTATLIQLETAISDRQGQLESLSSQQRYLADQVDMSTLTLNLVSVADAPGVAPDNFFSGIIAGWNGFVAFFAGAIVAAGFLVPWIALVALIGAVVALIVRGRRRTLTTTANPTSPSAPAAQTVASRDAASTD